MDELHDKGLGTIRRSEEEEVEGVWEAEVTLPSGNLLPIELAVESDDELEKAVAIAKRVIQAIAYDEAKFDEQVAVKLAEMFNSQIPPRFKEPLTTEEMARAQAMAWLSVDTQTTEIKLYYDVDFAGDHYGMAFLEEDGQLVGVGLEG